MKIKKVLKVFLILLVCLSNGLAHAKEEEALPSPVVVENSSQVWEELNKAEVKNPEELEQYLQSHLINDNKYVDSRGLSGSAIKATKQLIENAKSNAVLLIAAAAEADLLPIGTKTEEIIMSYNGSLYLNPKGVLLHKEVEKIYLEVLEKGGARVYEPGTYTEFGGYTTANVNGNLVVAESNQVFAEQRLYVWDFTVLKNGKGKAVTEAECNNFCFSEQPKELPKREVPPRPAPGELSKDPKKDPAALGNASGEAINRNANSSTGKPSEVATPPEKRENPAPPSGEDSQKEDSIPSNWTGSREFGKEGEKTSVGEAGEVTTPEGEEWDPLKDSIPDLKIQGGSSNLDLPEQPDNDW